MTLCSVNKKEIILSDCMWRFESSTFQRSRECHLMKFMSNSAKHFCHYFGRSVTFIIFYSLQMDKSLAFFSLLLLHYHSLLSGGSLINAFWNSIATNCVPRFKQSNTPQIQSVSQLQKKANKQISLIKSLAIYLTKLHSDIGGYDIEGSCHVKWKRFIEIEKRQNNQTKKRERQDL